jgi:DNA-binding transcriptional MerR regulator
MRIGELSRQTGVSERLLRYYEEQGLLHPRRRPSGYREYAESDVATVWRIRMLLSAGLGTSVIAEVLPCIIDKGELVAPTCPELVAGLGRERDRISASIDEFVSARRILDSILDAASDVPAEPALR